jgi:AraC-like DNA-binding protein/mannose-6-phosphate isomerase-like protein (cupin superfamily)
MYTNYFDKLDYLDKEEYKGIKMYRIDENDSYKLPFFIQKYSMQAGSSSILHRHQFFQIDYVFKGKGRHLINNNEVDIIKGDIFVIPPYIPHRISIMEDSYIEIFELEFIPEFVVQNFRSMNDSGAFIDFMYIEPFLVSECQVKPRLNLAGKVQVEVESILMESLGEYAKKRSGFELLIKSQILKLLVVVGREFTKQLEDLKEYSIYDRHRDAIYASIDYINNHYRENISIEEAAHIANLSVSYFMFVFKGITSQTFTEYVNRFRISMAMELLKNTNKRVIDICMEAGFNSVDHFCRLFKQFTGISPLKYRKEFK